MADGSVVALDYECTLLSSGTLLQSTSSMGPLRFAVGQKRLPMWEEAVKDMRVGGQRRLLVPPSAAVALAGDASELVPEGETLRFDCTLRGLESGLAAAAVEKGLSGAAASRGLRLRVLLIGLSFLPYLLPEESRPLFWKIGSTGTIIGVNNGSGEQAPSPSSAESLLDSDAIERELYGR